MTQTTPPYQSFTASLLESMPPWARTIMILVVVLSASVSIAASSLNINVGGYLDRYVDVHLKRLESVTNEAADRIIMAMESRVDEVEDRMESAIIAGRAANERHDEQIEGLDRRLRGVESSTSKQWVIIGDLEQHAAAVRDWVCTTEPEEIDELFCN